VLLWHVQRIPRKSGLLGQNELTRGIGDEVREVMVLGHGRPCAIGKTLDFILSDVGTAEGF
jgi:hypothetical protein